MLSVLIPTYNYTIAPLVKEVHKQCVNSAVAFEILCFDDGSDRIIEENKAVVSLPFCRMEYLDKNMGRSAVRNRLAEAAKYQWLLFLDADTFPVQPDFIAKYLEHVSGAADVVYGGIIYEDTRPQLQNLLRWVYGKKREALPVHQRRKKTYLSFLSLNFLARKRVFEKVRFNEDIPNLRHEDTLFSFALQQAGIPLKHIHNPVYHLGLETSEVFLEKSLESVAALKFLTERQLIDIHYVKLSRYYSRIQKWGVRSVFTFIFVTFGRYMRKNLVSKHPNLFVFDLYRLSYLCRLYKK